MKNRTIIALALCAMPAGAAVQWAKMDNGADIAWEQAKAYCAGMGPGWRLPQVSELQGLFGGRPQSCGMDTCYTTEKLHLTGPWFWSADEVTAAENKAPDYVAWGVFLVNGKKSQNLRPIARGARAICVQGDIR